MTRLAHVLPLAVLLAASLGLATANPAAAAAPPGNDNFANAAVAGPLPATKTLDTSGATTETNEPLSFCGNRATVWYRFKPSTTVSVQIDTLGSNYNAGIAVWTGTTLTTLTQLDCNGDIAYAETDAGSVRTRQARLTFVAHAGVRYSIQVTSQSDQGGTLVLHFKQVGRPANDDFAGPRQIPSLPFAASRSTANASRQPGESNACVFIASTLWFELTPSKNETVIANTFGSEIDTVLAVYSGTALSNLVVRSCDDAAPHQGKVVDQSSVTWNAHKGTHYFIQVGGFLAQSGDVELSVSTITRPANDDFSAAMTIASLPASLETGNRAATHQQAEPAPNCGGDVGVDQTRWYKYTATSDNDLRVEVTGGPGTAAYVVVYTGASISTLTELGCVQADEPQTFDHVINGTTYYFQAAGTDGNSGPSSLSIDL
jgi:hypothetical protein